MWIRPQADVPPDSGSHSLRERVTGIEPALSAWEADVMPFHYIRVPTRTVLTRATNRLEELALHPSRLVPGDR